MNINEIFGTIEEMSVSDRVKFFRKIRDFTPKEPGKILEEAMREIPNKIIELIRKTSFAPLPLIGNGRAFDHEQENFLFCFDEANVHLYPAVAETLWNKIVNETPERRLYGLEFIARYIEAHPSWEKFARFIFDELFDGPRRNWESQDAVLKGLVSVNGRWPRDLKRAIEELPTGDVKHGFHTWTISEDMKRSRLADIEKARKEFEGQYPEKRLSKEESQQVIDKIKELFF